MELVAYDLCRRELSDNAVHERTVNACRTISGITTMCAKTVVLPIIQGTSDFAYTVYVIILILAVDT